MALNLTHPTQNLGTGDERANALLEFSGLVQANFPMATKLWPMMAKKTITSGKSYQFPFIGTMGYIEHTAGADLEGQGDPISEERTIPVDNKKIISHAWLTDVEEFVAHYSMREQIAIEASNALGRALDSRGYRMIALGARRDSRGGGEFPSGVLQRRNAASVAAGYPVTATGSRNFQDDLAAVGQAFRERNIPEEGWECHISPYLYKVLSRDNVITSREWVDPSTNNKITQEITKVENFTIKVTNNLPGSNVSTGESAYQGNFSYLAAVCVGHPGALGCVQFGGVESEGPEWKMEKQSHLMLAKWFGGIKWLRPEACAEIYCNTSAYTLSNGAYAP